MRISGLVVLPALAASGATAPAEHSGSVRDDIQLGPIRRFADERSAEPPARRTASSGQTPRPVSSKIHPDYDKSRQGAYTCYTEAKKAVYWSLTPDSDDRRKGRDFPRFFYFSCT
jgi:hypothetical protein